MSNNGGSEHINLHIISRPEGNRMEQLTTPTLKKIVRSVVRKADSRGDIDRGVFTLKVAKLEIAKALSIKAEELNEKPWKQTVKDLVYEAIENVDTLKSSPLKPSAQDDTKAEQNAFIDGFLSDEARSQERRKNENKSQNAVAEGKKGKRSKRAVDSDNDTRPSNQKANGKATKKDRKAKVVVSEDEEDTVLDVKEDSEDSLDELPPPPSRKRLRSDSESGGSEEDGSARRSSAKNGQVRGKGKLADTDGYQGSGKAKVKPSAKASTSTAAASSAPVVEDERVKELKSIVVACGVRKQWKKEFEGMTSANEQLAHLKRLLSSLGMTGRPTKGKAKAIKEKREMAAELGDVLEFEAKRGLGITSGRRNNTDTRSPAKPAPSKKRRSEAVITAKDEDFESSGSEEPPVPRKKIASPQKKGAVTQLKLSKDDTDDEEEGESK